MDDLLLLGPGIQRLERQRDADEDEVGEEQNA